MHLLNFSKKLEPDVMMMAQDGDPKFIQSPHAASLGATLYGDG